MKLTGEAEPHPLCANSWPPSLRHPAAPPPPARRRSVRCVWHKRRGEVGGGGATGMGWGGGRVGARARTARGERPRPRPTHPPALPRSLPHAHRRDGGRDHGRGDHAPGRPENAAHDPGRVRPVQGHRRLHDQDRARGGRRHPVQGAWREETEREREKDRGCTLQGTRTLSRSPPPILTPQGWEPRVLWIGLGGCVFFSALEQAKRAYAPKPEDWPPPAAAASRGKK